MNETHLMPDSQCGPTLAGKDPETGDEVWTHKNLINVKPI